MTHQKRQSPLGQARGHGSAKSGSHHWTLQRMTSVALVPLGLWFFYSLITNDLSNYQAVVTWLQSPFSFALMGLTLLVALYHGALGLQVVLEDYVYNEGTKFITLLGVKLIFASLALGAFYALIHIQSLSFSSTEFVH
ncbi:MAG TPA: succinate dehydrogenase, hydrophobic membrane anchor protein [Holosporales bacterium]|nr:succinate dehydrogenase, hydrophobic membrane anchor protein [Holosporales bacterium]